ncbi:MAG TPA: hypothetical protein VLA78_05990, partial [Paracoccaceae bacterium]|nr:hypothetical protein [Paracoccaceae bacterium]
PAGFDGRAYAQNLIRGAGAEGGDFMAGAADYIGRGDHLAPNPMPSPPNANAARLERDRSNHLSRAMLGPDGKIDPAGPAAQTAMGHLRFNPEVVATPTPALNVHAGRMMGTLSDPANLARAQTTLDGVGTPAGGAQNLLGRALGKPAGSVTQDDARQQVMGALMTPVHQGDVGSCFATAGVRRMSTSDPLEAMGRYAEIASTGIFRPRNGQDPIPAVQSFNPDENPLIRSLEYSAATVTAGMESNFRNQMMQRALTNSVAGLMDPVGDGPGFWSQAGFDNWEADEPLIRQTLVDSFAVEYDATRATPVSPDGSSSKGIYVLVQLRPSRSIIDTEQLFVAALTERVLTAIGEPADSDKAKKISAVINSRSYLDTLMQNGEAPWKMAGGGFGVEADNVLFGGTHATPEVTDARSGWDDLLGQTTTERSAEVLADILRNTQGNAAQMVPLETVGIHVFNALPNHPSMQALREGGDIEGNIQRTLVEPGRRVASTPLTDVRAGEITREVLLALKRWDGNRTRHALMDTALGGGPGASGLTPKALSARLMTALSAYLDRLALDLADGWRARELNAGTPHTDAERDAKRDENRVSFGKTAESMILSATMKEVRIPSVTIADSNWGDGTRDVMMVMAPHPHTGELVMWEQSLPGGSMSLMGEEWTDTTWLRVTGPGSS